MNRRQFNRSTSALSLGSLLSLYKSDNLNKKDVVGCQQYTFYSFLLRDGMPWDEDLAASVQMVKEAGITLFEPSFSNPEDVQSLHPHLEKHGLKMRSFYMNALLHEQHQVQPTIDNILATATKAIKIGAEIIVVNPTPIKWGGTENKSDEQLRRQGGALNDLGQELRKLGMVLAYHNHDAEMRAGAREFHHMMGSSSEENVALCLDPHWIYRGAGNSVVALMDIIDLYGARVVEIHLRQSKNGTWTEVFDAGDLDYKNIIAKIERKNITPLFILEQAAEEGTPQTLSAKDAIQKSHTSAVKLL